MIFGILRILGHSMMPYLTPEDRVLISSLPYLFSKPKIGDIVSFRESSTGEILLKRIVKISGDKYFLRGDNQSDSKDSRQFGFVKNNQIIGKIILKFGY